MALLKDKIKLRKYESGIDQLTYVIGLDDKWRRQEKQSTNGVYLCYFLLMDY